MMRNLDMRRDAGSRRNAVVVALDASRRWFSVATVIPAMAAALPLAAAHAGVEYVTPTTNCTAHSFNISNGGTMTVMSGPNMQFEVWGNSVDLTSDAGFTFAGPAGTGARIITRRSGADNQARGCGFVGSAVVRLDTPGNLGANAGASLSFRMPLGDISRLPMTVKAQPTFTTTWTTNGSLQPSSLPCIVKTGSISSINQDTRLVINLPPGASQDQSTCTNNVITLTMKPSLIGDVDVSGPSVKYTVTGLPAFVTANQPAAVHTMVSTQINLTINVAAIRALGTTSTSTIRFTNPIDADRTASLVLQVTPTAGQGFAQVAAANPASTGAGNPIDFTVRLSSPAAQGQTITWRMTQANCFREANGASAPYNATDPFQFFSFPAGQTSAIIRVISVNNGGCTDRRAPITHIFEAWVGDSRQNAQVTAVTTAPTYTRTTVSLLFP